MEIHLIRHTSVKIEAGICYGQSNLELDDDYLNDFQKISIDKDYDAIYSSPLKRCTQLANYFQFDYQTDDRLMEMNFGDWEQKNWDDIPKEEIQIWYDNYIETKAKNGESLLDLNERVNDFLQEIQSKHQNQKILIISHAGVIRCFQHLILNQSWEEIFETPIQFGQKIILKR